MLKVYSLKNGDEFHEDYGKNDIKALLENKKQMTWFDISEPSEEELKMLSDVFGFHPLTVEDCSHYTDLPKIDEFDDYLFLMRGMACLCVCRSKSHNKAHQSQTAAVVTPKSFAFVCPLRGR